MNENQNYEKSLEDAVERLVHGKKASGNASLDALGQTKPEADPAFINHLEERLMAELSTTKTKKELAMLKRKERPSRFGRWPLTMAAAVLAILLVGGWLLYANQKPMQTAAHASATPIPMIPVVIAIQDIPLGTEITPDRVGIMMFPADVTPRGSFDSIQDVVGSFARADIYSEEVILARKITDEPIGTSSLPANGEGKTIGIVVGHQGNNEDSGASCPDGRTELSVNQEIARLLSTKLTEFGHTVSVLDESAQATSTADFTLILHSLKCYPEEVSDYQFMIPTTDIAPSLAHCIVNNYGQSEIDISFVQAAGFTVSDSGKPAMLVEIDALHAEPEEIDRIANELTTTLDCFFAGGQEEGIIAGLTPVVIPVQDIPMNTRIAEDMVALTYWPNDAAMDYAANNPGQWYSSSLDDVIGLNAQVFLPAFEPISRDDVSSNMGCDLSTGSCSYPIPNGYASIIYQTTDKAVLNFPAGSRVDVMVAMVFSDAEDGFSCVGCAAGTNLVMQRTISNAIVLYTELIHPEGNEEVIAMLAVPEQDVSAFAWLAEADLPMMLIPHMEGEEASVAQSQALNHVETPQTSYFVAIPLNQIESVPFGIYQGDTVNVYLNNSEMSFSGVVSYIGNSQYAPDNMQTAVEAITQGNKDVLILSVASMDIVDATNNYSTSGLSFEMVTISESTNPNLSTGFTIQQWFDASALSFNVGDNVDVVAQFTYLDETGEPVGMIRQRMGVDMLITAMEAGTGESAAYALVSLVEQNVPEGQMLASFQTCCHGTGTTRVLESWTLVPYNPNLPAATDYFGYNQRGEPVPLAADSLAEGHHYVALPLLHMVQSVAGGLTVGDNISLIFTDGSSIEGQISYLGSAVYAPFAMQESVDSFRAESPRTIILEVSRPEDAAAIRARVDAGESLTIDIQR